MCLFVVIRVTTARKYLRFCSRMKRAPHLAVGSLDKKDVKRFVPRRRGPQEEREIHHRQCEQVPREQVIHGNKDRGVSHWCFRIRQEGS